MLTKKWFFIIIMFINGCVESVHTDSTNESDASKSILQDWPVMLRHSVVQDLPELHLSQPIYVLDQQVRWESSGYYEDGSVMGSHEISHYQVMIGRTPETLNKVSGVTLSDFLTFQKSSDMSETWYLGVKTVSIYGSVSQLSNIIQLNL